MLDDQALRDWFCWEVLPLEPVLTGFIRRHCRSGEDVADIRQEVYEKVLTAAARALPIQPSAYVFATVRNVMINRARRASVISIELVATLDDITPDADWLTPDRHVDGRQELHRVQLGLDRLPPRCREVIWLRKVEGLSTREVAERLGVGIDAVEQQTMLGMRALTDFMLGGEGRIKRPPRAASRNKGKLS
jgi:RNA polymerase sigma factor (sigma-70 family)